MHSPLARASRKSKIIIMCVMVSFVAILLLSWSRFIGATGLQSEGPASGPACRLLSPDPLDLGTGELGANVDGEFVLRNDGVEPLEFKVTGSCTCASISPASGKLVGGKSESIKIAIRLAGEGVNTTSLRIETNDPRQAIHDLRVCATAASFLTTAPRSIDFGIVSLEMLQNKGTVPHKTIEIVPLKLVNNEGLPLDVGKFRVKSSGGSLRIEERANSGKLDFTVMLRDSMPVGRVCEVITIRTEDNGRKMEAVVPVTAEIVKTFAVAPHAVRLSRGPATLVMWKPTGAHVGVVTGIYASPGFEASEVTDQTDRMGPVRRRVFKVSQSQVDGPVSMAAPVRGHLQISISGANEPVIVPLEVYRPEGAIP